MNELPVGRRVAHWRVRRNMTQQQFADRLGKSKSWVDKVERGVRRLERVSSLREVAEALRIDLEMLLADRAAPADRAATGVARGVEGIRAALARYHVPLPVRPPDVAQVRARLGHAEQSYRHARYPELLALLPGLLDAAREARATAPGRAADGLLVSGYGLVALVLVKVGQGELAWLAADRGLAVATAVATAAADPWLAAATVPLCQALRASGRLRPAVEAAVVAAHRIGPGRSGAAPAAGPAVRGTLLIQAALAAAGRGDERAADELLGRAEEAARAADPADLGGAGFGRAAVEAAWVVAGSALGQVTAAAVRHERLIADDGWRWLPPEHRAAYLLDVARLHAAAGDGLRAGRAVLDAERTARGEVHDRPAARELVGVVARSAAAPAALTRLAATLGVT
ncbi:helix-turn-helix domain-containing protein [Micromonospora carbonacea]|uniref:Transcriptional regulator, contains XRE-family HTH domain n=1 Tax=Micromonospora carbonacea TaxID=47853 RepID=A0A1C4ZF45_9ACTN|nr:helix-turn-helix domain-containing protein [Micromonospora carbonacea]SCF31572.1 Transcriptional regulator, contains XRE-family HTH domain [Micromonospora carbonacea]